MFGFHAWDLLVVLLIALIIFGPRKLPEIGAALGKSIREFKKTTSEVTEQIQLPSVTEKTLIPSLSASNVMSASTQPETAEEEEVSR